jgi:polar amino acid transport system substrate-binding protein
MKFATIALILSFTVVSNAKDKIVTLRSDVWCPYVCDDKKNPGALVELSELVFGYEGYKIDFKTLSWARAVSDTEKGLFNGIVGASHSDAPTFVFPKIIPLSMNSCFYTHPDSKWTYKGHSSLVKAKLGASIGYTYGEEADTYIEKNKANKAAVELIGGDDPSLSNIKKLQAKRLDVIIDDRNVLNYNLRKNKDLNFQPRSAGCLKPIDLSLGFSPKLPESKEFAKAFDTGLEKAKANGNHKKIIEKYGITQ